MGEDLVKRYVVEPQRRIKASFWFYRSGRFAKSPVASRIKAEVMPAVIGHSGNVSHDVLALQIPHGLVVPRPLKVRVQAMSERIGGESDRLPDKGDHGRLIRLTRTQYPSCLKNPNTIAPGQSIKLLTKGFTPSQAVNLFFDDNKIANGVLDDRGNRTVMIPTPRNAKKGLHLIVVAQANKALTAHCVLRVIRESVGNSAFRVLQP